MATWRAAYRRPNQLCDYLYFSAADARSTTDRALAAASANARKRAQAKLEKAGILDAEIVAVRCVG